MSFRYGLSFASAIFSIVIAVAPAHAVQRACPVFAASAETHSFPPDSSGAGLYEEAGWILAAAADSKDWSPLGTDLAAIAHYLHLYAEGFYPDLGRVGASLRLLRDHDLRHERLQPLLAGIATRATEEWQHGGERRRFAEASFGLVVDIAMNEKIAIPGVLDALRTAAASDRPQLALSAARALFRVPCAEGRAGRFGGYLCLGVFLGAIEQAVEPAQRSSYFETMFYLFLAARIDQAREISAQILQSSVGRPGNRNSTHAVAANQVLEDAADGVHLYSRRLGDMWGQGWRLRQTISLDELALALRELKYGPPGIRDAFSPRFTPVEITNLTINGATGWRNAIEPNGDYSGLGDYRRFALMLWLRGGLQQEPWPIESVLWALAYPEDYPMAAQP